MLPQSYPVNSVESSRPARSLIVICVLLASAIAFWGEAHGQGDASSLERAVKAAFLYKFAEYVEWPDTAFPRSDTPVIIGVMGDDRLADDLVQVIGQRTMNGRGFEVRRLPGDDPPADIHILFISRAKQAALRKSGLQSPPVLVVTDISGAATQGSTINFVVVEERVRFEVFLDDAERRGLKLSSRLLTVAQNVRTSPP